MLPLVVGLVDQRAAIAGHAVDAGHIVIAGVTSPGVVVEKFWSR